MGCILDVLTDVYEMALSQSLHERGLPGQQGLAQFALKRVEITSGCSFLEDCQQSAVLALFHGNRSPVIRGAYFVGENLILIRRRGRF